MSVEHEQHLEVGVLICDVINGLGCPKVDFHKQNEPVKICKNCQNHASRSEASGYQLTDELRLSANL
jgi:hypothetical protein